MFCSISAQTSMFLNGVSQYIACLLWYTSLFIRRKIHSILTPDFLTSVLNTSDEILGRLKFLVWCKTANYHCSKYQKSRNPNNTYHISMMLSTEQYCLMYTCAETGGCDSFCPYKGVVQDERIKWMGHKQRYNDSRNCVHGLKCILKQCYCCITHIFLHFVIIQGSILNRLCINRPRIRHKT